MIKLSSILSEDLRKWFGKGPTGGWDRYNSKGEKVGKCGDSEEGSKYAACLSNEKAAKLGKDGRTSFVKRKQTAQSKAGDAKKGGEQKKGQKPVFVKTGASENKNMNLEEKLNLFLEKNVPTDPSKWAASIAAAKKKFDVYPSAYANGWAAKNYKEKGGGWKVAKEGVQNNIDEAIHPEVYREFMQACNDAGLNSFQIFGMHVLVYILTLGATGLTILSALGIAQLAKDAKDTFNNWNAGRKLNPEKVKAIVKDFENKVNKLEGGRKKFFQGIINKMKRTNPENKSALVSINRDLEHYAQAYGIKDESVINEACWDGYKQVGMKKKGDRQVPNCVPVNEYDDYDELDVEDYEEEDFLNFLKSYTTEINEAEYQGREVKLGKPMQGDVKKFKVYVKNPSTGKIIKVNFGHGGTSAAAAGEETMRIRKSNPDARRAFRARHNCDEPGPRTKARYWSCKKW